MFGLLEIAIDCFSLDYKLAIFMICKFYYIQASKKIKYKIAFLCKLMILASYCNVQIASFASWDIQDSDVQEDNFSSLK